MDNSNRFPRTRGDGRQNFLAEHRGLMANVYALVAEMGSGEYNPIDELKGLAYALGAATAIAFRQKPSEYARALAAVNNEMIQGCEKTAADLIARNAPSRPNTLGSIAPAKPVSSRDRDHGPRVSDRNGGRHG